MKKLLILITIVIVLFALFLPTNAEEITTTAKVINMRIDDKAQSVSITNEMSASVKPNDCNTCIKYMNPSECLVVCEQVVYYDKY